MQPHEYANLFPMMANADLQRVADDIKENGLNDDIITHQGKILDGRNRFKACEIAGVDPRFTEYDGNDPLAFVISHNLHRRHLNEAQRGMVGAKLANLQHGGDRKSDEIKSAIAPLIPPVTQKQAAAMLNVGVDSIKRSKQVMRTGIPELQDMQMSGEIAAVTAAAVAKLPKDEQRKAITGGVAGVKEAAKKQSTLKPVDSSESADTPSTISEKTMQEQSSTPRRTPNYKPSEGLLIWGMAKSQLVRINKNDTQRIEALNKCIQYCQDRITSNK